MKAKKKDNPPHPAQYEAKVLDEMIMVEPGAWRAYPVPIDLDKMPGCHIKGAFNVAGGYGSDIEVIIFYERCYRQWEHRMVRNYRGNPREVPSLYRSGRVAMANFDIELPRSDTYYFVFNNHFSNFSYKEVTARVFLSYGE
jgi:hypothetical protein